MTNTYLIFDTETDGLPKNYNAPVTDVDNYPRLVQLAFSYRDENNNELQKFDCIIKPNGFVIPDSATKIHGISNEYALENGIDLDIALRIFSKMLNKTNYLVAHNIRFDEKIIGAEFIRKNIDNKLDEIPKIYTMISSVKFCRLPGNYGNYKWAKLSELHFKLFGIGFDGAHDAMVDVNACARCFFELKNRNIIKIK